MPIVTDQNIVPLMSTSLAGLTAMVTGIIVAMNRANKAQVTADSNHAETLRHIQRLDDHNNSVGVAVATALADSVPITSVAALTTAVVPTTPTTGEGT